MRSTDANVVISDDLACIVDPSGFGGRGTRKVDRKEVASAQQKAMVRPAGKIVAAYNLASVIDPEGAGGSGAGEVYQSENAVIEQEAMSDPAEVADSYNLARVVDPEGTGCSSARAIDGGKATAAK